MALERLVIRGRMAIGIGSVLLSMLACNLPSTATPPAFQLPPTVTAQPTSALTAIPPDASSPEAPGLPTPSVTESGSAITTSPSADLQLTDLSLTSGGNIALHVASRGPDDLEQAHVMMTLQIGGGGATAGPHGPTRMWVTLRSGGNLILDTGVSADTSQGAIQITASILPDDFQDPNRGNNQVTKSFAGQTTPTATTAASPLQVGTMLPVVTADIELSGVVNTTSGNVMQLQINNKGPSDLKGAKGSFSCYVTYRKSGASAWTQVGSSGDFAMNIPAGGSDLYSGGVLLPWDDIEGQINCTISSDVLDVAPGNNTWASSIH